MGRARGRKLSLEHRRKIGEALKGRVVSPETRQKISRALRGRRGEQCAAWKGGRVDNNGYVGIYSPEHPSVPVSGYMMEHRLVVEKALGRYLGSDELVHHINGIRDDNRLENLRLVTHHKESICPRCGWPMDDLGNLAKEKDW